VIGRQFTRAGGKSHHLAARPPDTGRGFNPVEQGLDRVWDAVVEVGIAGVRCSVTKVERAGQGNVSKARTAGTT
jgi:hypothetical protein